MEIKLSWQWSQTLNKLGLENDPWGGTKDRGPGTVGFQEVEGVGHSQILVFGDPAKIMVL